MQPELYCRADRVWDAFRAEIRDRTRHHPTNKRDGMLARSHSKWRVAAKHGEDPGRQAIDIRSDRDSGTLEELRRDVGQGSDHLLRGGLTATRHARDGEVAKLRFPISSEQDISPDLSYG